MADNYYYYSPGGGKLSSVTPPLQVDRHKTFEFAAEIETYGLLFGKYMVYLSCYYAFIFLHYMVYIVYEVFRCG